MLKKWKMHVTPENAVFATGLFVATIVVLMIRGLKNNHDNNEMIMSRMLL